MRSLSTLSQRIPASPTIALIDKEKRLIAEGRDVIPLAGGDPDFDTPAHIVEAGIEAIKTGKTHYAGPSKGIRPLLDAIAQKMERDNHMTINPNTDIVATPGGKWALNLGLMTLLDPGDEVLILEPVWVSYIPMVIIAGGTPVPVPTDSATNFMVTEEALRSKITPKTKALMMNTPNNPTGRVFTEAEIQTIAKIAIEFDLYVLADEIYESIIFDNNQHISIGSLPGMAERTLVANGVSKGYAMTGWRLGWLVGPAQVMKAVANINTQTVTAAATFTMHAAVAALTGDQEATHMMCRAYEQRRDFVVKAFSEIEGISCRPVEGTFYLFPSFPNSSKNSIELTEAILEQAEVSCAAGSDFGMCADGHIRISIAASMEHLEKMVERMVKVTPNL